MQKISTVLANITKAHPKVSAYSIRKTTDNPVIKLRPRVRFWPKIVSHFHAMGVSIVGTFLSLENQFSDPVVVMGWSTGAETALGAMDASSWAGNKQKDRFVAAVVIYPWCEGVGQFFSPALIISAELDKLARPSSCERLIKSVSPGLNVPVLEIMPGAYHWFDMLHRPAKTFGGTYEYNAKATDATVNHVRSYLEGKF